MQWPRVSIEQVAVINPRNGDVCDLPDDLPVSFVPMQAVSEETASITIKETRQLGEVRRGYTPFRDCDVLLAKITPCMENGKCAVARGLINGIGFGSTEFHVLRAGPAILPEYLYSFVRQESFRAAAKQQMRGGAGQQRVPEDLLRQELIPLPPPSEQRRIVEILDQADRLRRLRAEADAKANRILPALYNALFLGPASTWPTEALAKHLRTTRGSLQSGPFGSHLHNLDFVEQGPVRVVGIDNVFDGEFVNGRDRRITAAKYEELKKFKLEPGDVLVTIMGTIGRCCVFPSIPEPAICTKHVYRIQLAESLDPEYVSASIRYSPSVRAQLGASVTGQIVAGITSRDLRQIQVPIPPRKLQDRFACVGRTLRQERDVKRLRRTRLDDVFGVLVHRAFSGDLTASWREAHMEELLREMEQRAQALMSTEVAGC